jgi:hypothetical protein
MAVAMDAKDDSVQSENADPDEMKFNNIGGDRGEDIRKILVDDERLGGGTEMEIKCLGNKATTTESTPISLGDLEGI